MLPWMWCVDHVSSLLKLRNLLALALKSVYKWIIQHDGVSYPQTSPSQYYPPQMKEPDTNLIVLSALWIFLSTVLTQTYFENILCSSSVNVESG